MRLTNGARLGPYQIESPIAAGGMGEVYRARDTRLGRSVAIKVLPVELSQDANLRLRFEREARALSNLNHPNICALYDVGEVPDEKVQYIVMEYLEGETLEHRLKRGPLPLDQALRYGLEIADALDKAHRKQILHRDLKPSNIMITKAGARLFDFGLAKFLHPTVAALGKSAGEVTSSAFSQAKTPEKSITAEGSVIGTLEYMAPEQLQGKEPDARTDIFSFGVCLYQMITGKRPFQGSSRAAVIAAILDQEPVPISTSFPGVPRSIEWLVKDCLAKDADERLQTAHDVVLDLKRIAEERTRSVDIAPSTREWRSRYFVRWTAIAILIAAGTTFAIWRATRRNLHAQPIKRFSINLPASTPIVPGNFEKFAVSPDGTRLVYVGGKDQTRLYLYSLDTREMRPLPDTDGARGPFFSPDGEWIGFYTVDRELKKIAVRNGRPTVLSTNRDLRGAAWASDDTIVFAELRSPLQRISASGGRSEIVTQPDPYSDVRWPSFLPGTTSVLYTLSDFSGDYENAKLAATSLKTGVARTILDGATCGRYIPEGYLAYLHSQTLFAVRFDPQALKVIGAAVPIVDDVESYFASGLAQFAVSSDGSIFYLPRDLAAVQRELVWVDRSGKTTPITSVRRPYDEPRLSPNGKQLMMMIGSRPRTDLWLYDIDRDAWTRLTSDATNESAIWSPDGTRIAFASNRHGGFELYIIPVDGSAPPNKITSHQTWNFPTSWSADGKTIAVVEQFRARFGDIFTVSAEPGAIPQPFVSSPFNEHGAVFSPDGRWIAYESNESGREEIYVQSFPSTGRKWAVSTSGGTHPAWRRDGAELFYRAGSKMMSVTTQLHPQFSVSRPRVLFTGEFENEYDVAADGERFVMLRRLPESPRTQINVVLGVFGNLRTNNQ